MSSCSYVCWLAPEPHWTNKEKEMFWNVLEAHMKRLLSEEVLLPSIALDHYTTKTRGSEKNYKVYNSIIREYMWCGRYSLAVSLLKALHKSFQVDPSNELMVMKRIFMEKEFRGLHSFGGGFMDVKR